MKKGGAISSLLVILLLVVALGAGGFFYMSYEKEKVLRIELDEELDEIKDQKDRLQARIAQVENEKMDLLEKMRDNEALVIELNSNLTSVLNEKDMLIQEKANLINDIRQVELKTESLQQKLDNRLTELLQLQEQLDTAIAEKEKMAMKISGQDNLGKIEAQQEELEKIVVSPVQFEVEGPEGETLIDLAGANVGEEAEETLAAEMAITTEEEMASYDIISVGENEEEEEVVLAQLKQPEIKEIAAMPKEKLSHEGSVVLINHEYNFLIIDLGSNDGVATGDAFDVLQGGISIGRIKIEKLHESLSAASFLEGFKVDLVKEEDRVKSVR